MEWQQNLESPPLVECHDPLVLTAEFLRTFTFLFHERERREKDE
jgi:hypothetical protein